MKYRFLSVINDSIIMICNYLIIVPAWMVVYACFGFDFPVHKPVLLFVIPVICYLYRRFIDKLWLFLLLHIIVPVAFFAITAGAPIIEYTDFAIVICITIYSFALRLKREEPGEILCSPIFAAALFIVVSIVIWHIEAEELFFPLTVIAVSYAALAMLQKYIDSFIWFDFMNKKTVKDIPTGGILKASAPYVTGLFLMYAAASLILLNEKLMNSIYLFAKEALIKFLRFLFSLIHYEETKEVTEVYSEAQNLTPDFSMLAEPKEESLLWTYIKKFLFYLAIFVFVFAIGYAVFYGIRALIEHFKGKDRGKKDEINADFTEEREKIRVKGKEKTSGFSLVKKPFEKIRRLYFKLAKTDMVEIADYRKITIRDFAEAYPKEKSEAAFGFACLYEKARYSPMECTKKDYELAKEYASVLMR